MSEPRERRAGSMRIDPMLLPRVMLWSVLVAILSYTVADPDLWGHVRFGIDTLERRAIVRVDPYSFTSDRPWVNHEWLSEVFMGAAYLGGGSFGLSLMKFVLLILALAVIERDLARQGVSRMARDGLLMVTAIGSITLTRTFRPQTFSLLLFACLVIALRRAEQGHKRWLWVAPPIMALWANLHGGWLVGLGILGIWCGVRAAWPMGASRGAWAAAGVLSAVATLATPEGVGLWRFLWDTVGLGRPDITEWQPLTGLPVADAIPWAVCGTVALVGIVRARQRSLSHVLVTAVLLFVSFRVWRVVSFLAVAVIVLWGPALVHRSVPTRGPATRPTPRRDLLIAGIMAALAASAGSVHAYRNLSCIHMEGSWIGDQDAAAYIRSTGLAGPTLTWFDWGQYAIWHLSPPIVVSMDGRRETVYSDQVIQDHLAIYFGLPGWRERLEQINPEHVWLPKSLPTVGEIHTLGWRPLFETDISVILTRTAPATVRRPSKALVRAACFPGDF
jgi:hypothetical protein